MGSNKAHCMRQGAEYLRSFAGDRTYVNLFGSPVSACVYACACLYLNIISGLWLRWAWMSCMSSSDFSLEVSLGWVRCVRWGRVPVLIVQFQTVFLLPRHDRQLGGHGLEAVPGALVLGVGLVLTEKDEKGKGAMLGEKIKIQNLIMAWMLERCTVETPVWADVF